MEPIRFQIPEYVPEALSLAGIEYPEEEEYLESFIERWGRLDQETILRALHEETGDDRRIALVLAFANKILKPLFNRRFRSSYTTPRENFSQQGICKRAIARILKRREKPAVFVFDRNQRLNGNRAARRLFLARPEHCPSTMDKRYIGCQKTHFHGHTDSDQPRPLQDTLEERTVSLRDLAAPTRV